MNGIEALLFKPQNCGLMIRYNVSMIRSNCLIFRIRARKVWSRLCDYLRLGGYPQMLTFVSVPPPHPGWGSMGLLCYKRTKTSISENLRFAIIDFL